MTFQYTDSTPGAAEILANSQPLMLDNTRYLKSNIGKDHNFTSDTNNTNDGFHKVIHFVNQGADPPTVGATGELYTKTFGTTQGLFFQDSAGTISQLFGNVALTNGYAWVGGILLQWGTVGSIVGSGTPTTVLFATANINFPNACFNVQMTLDIAGSSGTTNAQTIALVSKSDTQFVYNYSGGSAYNRFYWMAIGN